MPQLYDDDEILYLLMNVSISWINYFVFFKPTKEPSLMLVLLQLESYKFQDLPLSQDSYALQIGMSQLSCDLRAKRKPQVRPAAPVALPVSNLMAFANFYA